MKLLAVPKVGFVSKSVTTHRSNLMVVTDWVEGSSLFYGRPISRMEVRDFLIDYNFYEDQTFAMEFVEQVWGELRKRSHWLSASPVFKIDKDKIEPNSTWDEAVGYSFCLMLSFLQRYSRKQHKRLHSKSYTKQGSLFEELSEQSLTKLGWKTLRTGWASGISNPKFKLIVNQVASELNEDWISKPAVKLFKDAKEEGLDLVIHRPFVDPRWGRAYFLIQCASGGDWEDKLHTPCLEVWSSLVSFTTQPRRGFCFPLALDDDHFRMSCMRCSGIFLDRFRLLSSGTSVNSGLSTSLVTGIKTWLRPRVMVLPSA
jgi:hypothetical protein